MAGKTFPGIGDLEDEVPPLDPADAADSSEHTRSDYSGPTVVDDAKVEQGLKKLRSLDAAPNDIQQAIADVLADPARATPSIPVPAELLLPEITIDPGRGTAVGRSVSGPVVGQQTTQPVDDRALRGTMFGHGVHLPDLEEARRAMQVEPSKALAVVDRGVPTTNEITVFQPGTYPQQADIPRAQDGYPRASRSRAEDTPIELRTVLPRKQLMIRVALTGAGILAIVVAALLWVRANDESDLNARSGSAIPPPPPKPVQPQPIVPSPPPPAPAPSATAPALAPAPAPPPPAAVVPTPAPEPPASTETKSTRPSTAAEPTAHRSHGSSTHAERHRAPGSSEAAGEGSARPDDGARPDKPDKPSRAKRPVEDDPDGTMAPTIE